MICTAYRKIRHGSPLTNAEARLTARTGTLRLYARVQRGGVNQILLATLLGPEDSYLIPCFDHAALVKIENGGLMLVGAELIPRGSGVKRLGGDRFPQTWWCVPRPGV